MGANVLTSEAAVATKSKSKRKPKRLHKKAGRPVGTRMPHPENPDRVRAVVRAREDEGLSYEAIARRIGISRVAVRLLYLRWKDHSCAQLD